jgi:hypothetical protein
MQVSLFRELEITECRRWPINRNQWCEACGS